MKLPTESESPMRCECGGDYLHHEQVEVFERAEDAQHGLHVLISGTSMAVGTDVARGNPSPRRHGLTIKFTCEMCDRVSVLSIVQHKGQTFIYLDSSVPAKGLWPVAEPVERTQ